MDGSVAAALWAILPEQCQDDRGPIAPLLDAHALRRSGTLLIGPNHFVTARVQDSSHYAIPAEETVSKWVKATPKGFIFHFKIFQLFSSMSAQFSVLPKQVRESMEPPESPEKRDPTQLTRYSEVPSELRQLIWDRCNAIFQVAHAAGRLGIKCGELRIPGRPLTTTRAGVIVFQFQIGYKPTDENTAYLRTARSKLGADFQMVGFLLL